MIHTPDKYAFSYACVLARSLSIITSERVSAQASLSRLCSNNAACVQAGPNPPPKPGQLLPVRSFRLLQDCFILLQDRFVCFVTLSPLAAQRPK
jgi:hypothetical protein